MIGEDHFAKVLPNLRLVKCRHCGLVYVNPRPAPEQLRTFYEQPGYGAHAPEHGKKYDYDRLAMLANVSKGRQLLDVGCGGGTFMVSARENGYDATGIEPSSQGRHTATQAGFKVYEDCSAPLKEGRRFDAITIWHVLEHVPDIQTFLGEIRLLLAPGGVVMIAVPNTHSARVYLLRLLPCLRPPDDDVYRAFPIHLYAFSRRSLRTLLRHCGLSILSSTTRSFGLGECFRRRRCPPRNEHKPAAPLSPTPAHSASLSRHIWLRPLERIFFSAHLGDSLVMIAGRGPDGLPEARHS